MCGTCLGDLGCDNRGNCVTCDVEPGPNGSFETALVATAVAMGESGAFSSTLHDTDDADLIRIDVEGQVTATIRIRLTGFSPSSDNELIVFPWCESGVGGFSCFGTDRVRETLAIGGGTSLRGACRSFNAPGVDEEVNLQVRCADGDPALFLVLVRSEAWDSCSYDLDYTITGP